MKNLTLNIEPPKFKDVSVILETLRNCCSKFGYEEFFPSTLEYFEEIRLVQNKNTNQLIKFVSPLGEIMTLKDDPTLPVTKYAALRDFKKAGYSKYYYATNIFKWTSNTSSSAMESLQGGIEYYGNPSLESDSEIIFLGTKVLEKLGLSDFKIDIGEINYLHGLLDELKLTNSEYENIVELVERKNIPELSIIAENLKLDEKTKIVLLEIPKLFGEPIKILEKGKDLALNSQMEKSIDVLSNLLGILNDLGLSEYVEIDLGFSNNQKYYTGTIFKLYSMNSSKTVLSGGRYDNLSKSYAAKVPACGAAFNIKNILEVINMKNTEIRNNVIAVVYSKCQRKSAYQLSTALRDMGYIVKANQENEISTEIINSEYYKDIDNIVTFDPSCIKVLDQKLNTSYKTTYDAFLKKIQAVGSMSSIH